MCARSERAAQVPHLVKGPPAKRETDTEVSSSGAATMARRGHSRRGRRRPRAASHAVLDDRNWLVASGSTLRSTNDAGATWVSRNVGLPGPIGRLDVVDPAHLSAIVEETACGAGADCAVPFGLYVSGDRGMTWRTPRHRDEVHSRSDRLPTGARATISAVEAHGVNGRIVSTTRSALRSGFLGMDGDAFALL